MLRGSREFSNRKEYQLFIDQLFEQLNRSRKNRFSEELQVLKLLPRRRYDGCKRQKVKVGPSSTIHVQHNVYSVPSRLIGEWVEVRIKAQDLELWYMGRDI